MSFTYLSYFLCAKDEMMSARQPRADAEDDDRDYSDVYSEGKIGGITLVNAVDN